MKSTAVKKEAQATEEQLLNPKGVKSISEVLPNVEFYPELPRANFKDLVDCMIIISDAKLIETNGDFGAHSSALIKYVLRDDIKVEYTTISSGQVIVDKMARLIANNLFPVAAIVSRVNSPTKGRSPYYDLI
jgi:hypothetical protein